MIALRWTETAIGDLESIRDYIRHDSPIMAQLVTTRLHESVSLLRELIRPPYRIVYERLPDAVEILTVFHAARMFPPDIGPPAR